MQPTVVRSSVKVTPNCKGLQGGGILKGGGGVLLMNIPFVGFRNAYLLHCGRIACMWYFGMPCLL